MRNLVIKNLLKEKIMNTQSVKSKFFSWVFFLLSVGMLIAGGIYIEKIVLTSTTTLDVILAVLFSLLGAGISAYSFFGSRQET
jgi:hypothetical protein